MLPMTTCMLQMTTCMLLEMHMLKCLLTVALFDDDLLDCDNCYVTKCYVTVELKLRLNRDKTKQMSVRMIYKCTLNVCTNQDVARNQQENECNLDK